MFIMFARVLLAGQTTVIALIPSTSVHTKGETPLTQN